MYAAFSLEIALLLCSVLFRSINGSTHVVTCLGILRVLVRGDIFELVSGESASPEAPGQILICTL